VALVVAGSGMGALAGPAGADTAPDGDLASLRLLVAAELLAVDFYTNALAAGHFTGTSRANLKQALVDERKHYESLAAALSAAGGGQAAVADDIDFAYPKRSFASRASIAKLGTRIETIVLGAYIGAVDAVQTDSLRLPLAQAAANEAQHLSVFSTALGRRPIGLAFAPALSIDQATLALDAFES
jgi:demethoxyubiquinone hydroxylase (CLK1/Coq7/Cat5 family)